ncbi:MAG: Antilisterial bacteriocin subtilosin biosynthesis protein AlbA [Syntrophaceae bacterium PtaU1.Bin231]|nr:MAG: Antilisterial bacteriocin subtilosin biosynthesis protein AlbA [Syntrophaceae bacterium PtaB.Bin038]OPY89236.1 MAG: Antilisterial bacteriocin subtilosin biosynthesis protein AlbA [Syntrophaceae bacterium PtaU1.Bin231]
MIVSANQTAPVPEGSGGVETAARPVPPLNTLYFYLTEGCNLRCRHCWIEPPHQTARRQYPAVDPKLFRHIVEQARPLGLSSVKLTGGEPLMHPQIGEILEVLRDEKLRFNVETNGVLCTPEVARDLARSGLYHISVSLDGADSETHEWVRGVRGCFDAAVAGIRNLVATGIRPQVIMTLMRRNVGQMEAVVRLAESLGASSVKFNILQPTARGVKMHEAGETLSIREIVALGERVEGELSAGTKLRLFYSHPAAFRPLGKMYGREGTGCGVCGIRGILGVLGNGSYALCGIGETVPELVFGDAAKDALADVWRDSAVLNEIRRGLPRRLEGICAECLMKGVCLGSCVAQNYYRSRNLWAPHWYCEEALREGLFPESRLKGKKGTAPFFAGDGV